MEDIMTKLSPWLRLLRPPDLTGLVEAVLPKTGSDAEIIVITSRQLVGENDAAVIADLGTLHNERAPAPDGC